MPQLQWGQKELCQTGENEREEGKAGVEKKVFRGLLYRVTKEQSDVVGSTKPAREKKTRAEQQIKTGSVYAFLDFPGGND